MNEKNKKSVAASVDNVPMSKLYTTFLTQAIRAERLGKGSGTPICVPVAVSSGLNIGLGSKK